MPNIKCLFGLHRWVTDCQIGDVSWYKGPGSYSLNIWYHDHDKCKTWCSRNNCKKNISKTKE